MLEKEQKSFIRRMISIDPDLLDSLKQGIIVGVFLFIIAIILQILLLATFKYIYPLFL